MYDWVPQAPTRLFYCTADDQVAFTNSTLADSVMNANGASDVMAVDVGPTLDHGACVQPATIAGATFFLGYRELITSAGEVPLASNIRVFPNPAAAQWQVEGLPEDADLHVLNLDGKTLESVRHTGGTLRLNATGYASGYYLLRVESAAGQLTLPLIRMGH